MCIIFDRNGSGGLDTRHSYERLDTISSSRVHLFSISITPYCRYWRREQNVEGTPEVNESWVVSEDKYGWRIGLEHDTDGEKCSEELSKQRRPTSSSGKSAPRGAPVTPSAALVRWPASLCSGMLSAMCKCASCVFLSYVLSVTSARVRALRFLRGFFTK